MESKGPDDTHLNMYILRMFKGTNALWFREKKKYSTSVAFREFVPVNTWFEDFCV